MISEINKESELVRYCHACHSKYVQLYHLKNGPNKWVINGDIYTLISCKDCDTISTYPIPSNILVKEHYSKNFNYKWYSDHYEAKYKDALMRLEEYKCFLGDSVLDYGGGIGYFSAAALNIGIRSETYDPFVSANEAFKTNTTWDSIVMLHVLEHMTILDAELEMVNSFLNKNGRLIIAVPNRLSKGYDIMGATWVWAQPPITHIHHFTAIGLTKLLQRHGFRILSITYNERWDANLESDVKDSVIFRNLEQDWSKPLFRTIPFYRKYIAKRNSNFRFKALNKALINFNNKNPLLSELQIICEKK